MKDFFEALKDGYKHITDITNIEELKKLRDEGVLVDEEGYYSFVFGENGEYQLCIEPFLDEGMYFVSLYRNRVLLTERLPMMALKIE